MQAIFFLFICLLLSLNSCFPIHSIFLGAPDRNDSQRFDFEEIHAASDCFEYFEGPTKSCGIKVNDWTTDIPFFVGLDALFERHATRGFILIQHDTILYEYYAEQFDQSTLHSSYSIAKCFTSTLIGIAIDGGYIKSEADLVTDYIPELGVYPAASTLTIQHLLNHTSGIAADLMLDALLYYGKDISKYLGRLHFDRLPGQKQQYLNVNTQLLALVLENATKRKLSLLMEQNIWQKMGACRAALWSTDKKSGRHKAFCCISATLRDYAKFGSLYLKEGQWGESQIFSKQWYTKSIRRDTSAGSSFNYNYGWHLGLKEYGDYMAIGLYKQHIYVYPAKNIVMVLLNDRENKLAAERVNWWNIFRQISDQI